MKNKTIKKTPGIDSNTEFVFRIDDNVFSCSAKEIFEMFNCNKYEENKVRDLEVVGDKNSFVKVDAISARDYTPREILWNITK